MNCKTSAKYCSWTVSRETPEAIVEVCEYCGRREVYKKRDGRIDNARYFENHQRDFAQPGSRAFEEIYGRRGLSKARQLTAQRAAQIKAKAELPLVYEEVKKYIKRHSG